MSVTWWTTRSGEHRRFELLGAEGGLRRWRCADCKLELLIEGSVQRRVLSEHAEKCVGGRAEPPREFHELVKRLEEEDVAPLGQLAIPIETIEIVNRKRELARAQVARAEAARSPAPGAQAPKKEQASSPVEERSHRWDLEVD